MLRERMIAVQAFAFYYMLQCLVTVSVSKLAAQRAGMLAIAIALGFITNFALPAG